MARPKTKVDKVLLGRVETALKKQPNKKVVMKLLAIKASAEQTGETVAQVMGVSRPTIYDWIDRFEKDGVYGLLDLPKGHNPSKLNESQLRMTNNLNDPST